MFLRKSTIVMLVVLMAMGMIIANVSYAGKYLDHVGSKGIDGADNVNKVEDGMKDSGDKKPLASNANIGDIIVSNDNRDVLTKNSFFEKNVNNTKIVIVTEKAIMEGPPEFVQEVYGLAGKNGFSVAIVVADQAQVEGVTERFREAGLSISGLIDETQIVFVRMRDNIIVAVNRMLEDNDYNLEKCTLSNLNAKYADAMGGQV